MPYAIDFVPSAAKELAKLPAKERQKLGDRINELAAEPRPHGVEKLTGFDAYRARVGDYRVVYEVHNKVLVVLVLAVGDRKEIYKRLRK